jgi:hypothetical protein
MLQDHILPNQTNLDFENTKPGLTTADHVRPDLTRTDRAGPEVG